MVGGPAGDYADYYKRIKLMAKDKGMKEPDMQVLLKDRQKGELEYKQVSEPKSPKIHLKTKSVFHLRISFFHWIFSI